MNIAGLHLEKPIMNASGTLSHENVHEVKDLYGAVVTKTVTLEPRAGNPPPRVAEVFGGMVNSIGLQNVGIEKFLEEELYEWYAAGLPVIVSIGGSRNQDFEQLCGLLAGNSRVAAIELNLSCPNNYELGLSFCANPENVSIIVERCTNTLRCVDGMPKPLIVKLAIENAVYNAQWAEEEGADALTLINSVPALTWLPDSPEPLLGGLSGPAIKPIALRAVYEVSRTVDVPLIASGGVASLDDIEDFIRAGASAVQIGSASFAREPREIVGCRDI